jgi:hypothetical protein
LNLFGTTPQRKARKTRWSQNAAKKALWRCLRLQHALYGCGRLARCTNIRLCEAEFIGKIRLLGVKLPTSVLASAAFVKI